MARISISIPEDAYGGLKSLSNFYKKDIEEIIKEIIEAVGPQSEGIIKICRASKVPLSLMDVVYRLFHSGLHFEGYLFNELLEILGVRGLFYPEDIELDFDKTSVWIRFRAHEGCGLYVDYFDVILSGLKMFLATHLMDVERVDYAGLRRIEKIARNIRWIEGFELPESFYDLMEFGFCVEEDDEFIRLTVYITEESLSYVPNIYVISELFKQILERAGLNHLIEEQSPRSIRAGFKASSGTGHRPCRRP